MRNHHRKSIAAEVLLKYSINALSFLLHLPPLAPAVLHFIILCLHKLCPASRLSFSEAEANSPQLISLPQILAGPVMVVRDYMGLLLHIRRHIVTREGLDGTKNCTPLIRNPFDGWWELGGGISMIGILLHMIFNLSKLRVSPLKTACSI